MPDTPTGYLLEEVESENQGINCLTQIYMELVLLLCPFSGLFPDYLEVATEMVFACACV